MRTKYDLSWKLLFWGSLTLVVWSMIAVAQTAGPTIEFSKPSFTVKENGRSAAIEIRRNGPTNGQVTVELATQDGTAIAGQDYTSRTGPITLPAGQVTHEVRLPIRDDMNVGTDRAFTLILSNPNGAELGPQRTAEVLIQDNDTTASTWVTFGLHRVPSLNRTLFDIPLWQYLAFIIYSILALYVSKFLDYFIRSRLKGVIKRTSTPIDNLVLDLLHGPLKIIALVIFLHIGLRLFSWPEAFEKYLSNGLKIVVAISLTYMAIRAVEVLTDFWRQRGATQEDRSFNEHLLPIIRNVLRVFVVILGILLTLQNLGFNINTLITSLGVGGVALALASQDTLSNFFGAVVVLLDKPFRIGDQIRLDPVIGTVENIGFRSTRVRTAEGHLASIPNKTVGNAVVFKLAPANSISGSINISLGFDTPQAKVQTAMKILEEVIKQKQNMRETNVLLKKFSDTALNIEAAYVYGDTDGKKQQRDLHEINMAIKDRFDREGINFALPTQNLVIKENGRDLPGARAAKETTKM